MEDYVLDTIDMRVLGKELQDARKRERLTQEDAAGILDVARTTITAIEKGERRIKTDELIKLARAYKRPVSEFVRPRPSLDPFPSPQYRGPAMLTKEDQEAIQPFISTLEDLCRIYIEIETLTKSPSVRRYPPQYANGNLSIEQAAESIALDERNRLGLGDGPIPLLRNMLEQEVGLRIFYISLPRRFSAIYCFTDQAGGCIAINADHPEERRRWSLAHDYCHFLESRYKSDILVEAGYRRRSASERMADSFAFYFLMPTSGLTRRYNEMVRAAGKPTMADLCTLANYYGVSVDAMMQRLETMGLVGTGTWDYVRRSGFKVREVQQQLGLQSIPAQDAKYPLRYRYLAVEALSRELITVGHFARLLEVEIVAARDIYRQVRSENGNDHNADVAVPSLDICGDAEP